MASATLAALALALGASWASGLNVYATVLVLGSEGEGLHQKIQEHCDGLLAIGMPGGIDSLNVSSAAAVMLFRVLAQRGAAPR